MTTYAFVDTRGEVEIPSPHGTPYDFAEGLARTPTEEGWAFIDTKGKVKLEVEEAFTGFSDGLALTEKGFVDTRGKVKLPVKFKGNYTGYVINGMTLGSLSRFHCGLCAIGRGKAKGGDGYIDKKGKVVLEGFGGGMADDFHDDKAKVSLIKPPKGEKSRLIDKKGNCLVSFTRDRVGSFAEGLAAVSEGGKLAFLDDRGQLALSTNLAFWIEAPFECQFSDGIALVRQNGKYGYIDRTGKQVIAPRFDEALAFREGTAPVKDKGAWGFIDPGGAWTITPRFAKARPFSHGLSVVWLRD